VLYEKISGFSDEIAEDIDTQFATLNKLGINYFEPRGINGKNISTLNDAEVEELKQKMQEYGIKASSIGSPIGKIRTTEDFEPHFEVYKRVVKTAKMLDCKYIRMFSFFKDGEWTEEKIKEVKSRLSKLIEYAKQEGVILLHENEGDIYGETIEGNLDIMQSLYCDNFKMVFDPANFAQKGVDNIKAIETLLPYVEYMHIKDHKKGKGIVPAGFGDGNVLYVINKLFAKGYKGFFSLEPHLGRFKGLAELELDGKSKMEADASADTFTLAANCFNDLLKVALESKGN
jgi:sugar phosphate isomerase/epimerase